MHARSIFPCCKPDHTEMPRLHGLCDVVSAHLSPTHQILRRDQDPAVGSGSATRAAGQAVEFFGHRVESMARGASGAHGGLWLAGV